MQARNSAGSEVDLAGQELPEISVRLRPGGALHGRLLRAEDDGPIADARLFFDTGEVLTTDDEGRFELLGLPMNDHSFIPVAPGRLRQYVLFDTTLEPEAELEVRLPRGAVLQGRITDELGQPIAGAFLTRGSSGSALTLNGYDEEAGDDGHYQYGGLSPTRWFYSLMVQAPGYDAVELPSDVDDPTAVIKRNVRLRRNNSTPDTSVPVESDKPSDVARQLPRRTLRGTVEDDAGQPIARAEIRWGSFQWDDSVKNVKTDAEGSYVLAGAPGGSGAIFVLADGFVPQFAPVRQDEQHFDVQLTRGTTVRGRVTNKAGRPIAGVMVAPQMQCVETGFCNRIWLSERTTSTDANGKFELPAMPMFGVTFDFLKDGYSEMRDVTLTAGESLNEIELTTGGAVHGRVVDTAGQPVRNFKVRVMIPRERDPNENVGGYYAGYDWYGVVFTRDDGEFVLTDVPAGALMRLVVSSPACGVGIVDRASTAPLDELPPAEDLTIELQPFQTLNVKVTEAASGKVVAGALVSLLEDEPDFSHGFSWGYHDLYAERRHTDETGTAHFVEPACQDGTLIVRAPGFARQRPAWTDGQREVHVALEPGADGARRSPAWRNAAQRRLRATRLARPRFDDRRSRRDGRHVRISRALSRRMGAVGFRRREPRAAHRAAHRRTGTDARAEDCRGRTIVVPSSLYASTCES